MEISEHLKAQFVQAALAGREIHRCLGYGTAWCGRYYTEYGHELSAQYAVWGLCPPCGIIKIKTELKRVNHPNYPTLRRDYKALLKELPAVVESQINFCQPHACSTCGLVHLG